MTSDDVMQKELADMEPKLPRAREAAAATGAMLKLPPAFKFFELMVPVTSTGPEMRPL